MEIKKVIGGSNNNHCFIADCGKEQGVKTGSKYKVLKDIIVRDDNEKLGELEHDTRVVLKVVEVRENESVLKISLFSDLIHTLFNSREVLNTDAPEKLPVEQGDKLEKI